MNLINGDCLEELKKFDDKSVDFFFLDLPYGQTACKWDVKIDLDKLWIEIRRLAKNERPPFFFSTTTKFGFELYKHAPKGWFRWDLVWKKNKKSGFLNAYKLPMRQHEMIYCFAKKTPDYDTSSHETGEVKITDSKNNVYLKQFQSRGQDPSYYDKDHTSKVLSHPLPTSDITQPSDDHELLYCFAKKTPEYDTSSHKEISESGEYSRHTLQYGKNKNNVLTSKTHKERLPTSDISSWCEYKNDNKTGHRTAKPVNLMKFLLKYWTKEGDVVCDPTAGSGSMGIACKMMNRKFIGIEKDELIFKLMEKRISVAVA